MDLTDALVNNIGGESKAEPLLRDTLSKWGWCSMSIDLPRLERDSPLQSIQPLNMKQHVQDLFDPSFIEAKKDSDTLVYRGRMAESGSGQEEPKQSWEVRRCCQGSTEELPILHQWTRALHSIAVVVTRVLQLSPNLLLNEDSCHCATNEEQRCNIDLLRVFLYDDVTDEDASMGSSPHTDWGSWTVVWQDDVGGLQTYCHEHGTWVNVPAPPLEASRVFFVVHVGDVTSLAMGRAHRRESQEDTQLPIVVWPSPRHRVLSPTNSVPRSSLVYFAYPPPDMSLENMEEALAAYTEDEASVVVPYNEYFVLQNQSINGSTSVPEETYAAIRSRPLGGVFSEKWQEVQRKTLE